METGVKMYIPVSHYIPAAASMETGTLYPRYPIISLQHIAWRQVEHFISPVSHYIPTAASMETGRTLHIPGILLYPCCSSHRNM